jgi:hypothetical protein
MILFQSHHERATELGQAVELLGVGVKVELDRGPLPRSSIARIAGQARSVGPCLHYSRRSRITHLRSRSR